MKFNTSKKIYLHIDCDSFFAWCELLKNPKLKGKCVCVWHEIILACSYEAKKLWIYTWMPVWEASRKLKSNWIFRLNGKKWVVEKFKFCHIREIKLV